MEQQQPRQGTKRPRTDTMVKPASGSESGKKSVTSSTPSRPAVKSGTHATKAAVRHPSPKLVSLQDPSKLVLDADSKSDSSRKIPTAIISQSDSSSLPLTSSRVSDRDREPKLAIKTFAEEPKLTAALPRKLSVAEPKTSQVDDARHFECNRPSCIIS